MPKRLHLPANKTIFNSKIKSSTQNKYSLNNFTNPNNLTDQRNTPNTNTTKFHQQSHIFIVILGAIIGGIIALAIGYTVKASFVQYSILTLIPLSMSLILSKVYIHTVIHYQD